ncbi:unnamed protein product [Vicia faba]|uniref:Uncharacterized protein n=1 Tax=Vicia faba TaxID=3906 RepID=A0AAV1A1I3_VICFA|nr:unnamed protein product [Vicia faba]
MKKDDGESLYLKCDDGKYEGGSVTEISEGMKMRNFRRNSERIQRKLAENLRLNEEDEGKKRMELRKGLVFLRISREREECCSFFHLIEATIRYGSSTPLRAANTHELIPDIIFTSGQLVLCRFVMT